MIRIQLQFADGVSDRSYNSTFDACCDILNAYNMYEEYFIGAYSIDNKEYVKILDAEKYMSQVGPVKDYLELATLNGFSEAQICEEISDHFYTKVSEMFDSWKQHMKEYAERYDRYIAECAERHQPSI